MAIVQKAISQVQEIIQRSGDELNSIGGKIRGLDSEYQALGNQKFANKEGPQFLGPFKEDKPSEDERRKNQIDAFRQVYGQDPISQNAPALPLLLAALTAISARTRSFAVGSMAAALGGVVFLITYAAAQSF